jgi:hypothetical protein
MAEWPNASVCKTEPPRVRIPLRVLMSERMRTPFNEFKSVEATKAASLTAQRLFPNNPLPIQGELQTITRLTWERAGKDDEIKRAGLWWLWFRNIFIENTMSRDAKRKIQIFACNAVSSNVPLTLVTTRSPELVHAQIGMADPSLPRSRKALSRLKELIDISNKHIPTSGKVFLADIAIDNVDRIAQVCDLEEVIENNIIAVKTIAMDLGLTCEIEKLSHLVGDDTPPAIPPKSWSQIRRVMDESLLSHTERFGWTKEQSEAHNIKLATTMGQVGSKLNLLKGHILLHNEAFISRGALNNIFNPPHDPLPVICLRDLLDSKRASI